jgi:hypothetical protein
MTPSVVEEGLRFVVNLNPIVRLCGIALLAQIPDPHQEADYQSSRERTGNYWPKPDFADIFGSTHDCFLLPQQGWCSPSRSSDFSIVRALNSGVAFGNKLKCQCGYR